MILGLLEFVVPFTLLSFASRWIPSSLSGVLMATGPLFAVAAALRVDPSEHLSRTRAAGLLMGMTGVLCLLGVEVTGSPEALSGAGFALLASCSFAFGAVHFHVRLSGVAPLGAVGAALVAGALLLLAPAAVALPHHLFHVRVVVALLVLGVARTALNYVLFFRLVGAIGAARASVTSYLSPAVAVILGVVFLHEHHRLSRCAWIQSAQTGRLATAAIARAYPPSALAECPESASRTARSCSPISTNRIALTMKSTMFQTK